jgi:hypothetical protein
MGLLELFVAVLIAGVSAVNVALPVAAWSRARDGRFLVLAAANGVFVLLGGLWTWWQLPENPPAYAVAALPVLAVALLGVLLLLAASLWPRRA